MYNETNSNLFVDGNNNSVDQTVTNVNNMSMNNNAAPTNMGAPIQEGVQEKCVHRTIMHEVPHVCPIHTRIINHHVYRHTYQPRYTCSEENVVSNVQCGSCCNFR